MYIALCILKITYYFYKFLNCFIHTETETEITKYFMQIYKHIVQYAKSLRIPVFSCGIVGVLFENINSLKIRNYYWC